MKDGRVGAVVVSYHPDREVICNLQLLRQQIDDIVVVDNGSPEVSLGRLRETTDELSLQLLQNTENLGIACALNQGVRRLREMGCDFALLFDQDSTVTEGYVKTMLQCFRECTRAGWVAILVPSYVDRRFGTTLEPPVGASGGMEAATTSGSLMPMTIFEAAGLFAEELFIDGVDYEYSLRVRRAGYRIAECRGAVLLHSPGSPTYHRVFGGKPFQAANYSPARRYYQERNKIWVAKRYWKYFGGFCAKQFVTSLKDLLKIGMVETNKWRKIRYFFLGVRDGLLGRTGRLKE